MNADGIEIKKNLEETFDIPFNVRKTFEGGEPCFILEPEDMGKELFEIRVSFRNQVRLIMDMVLHKYSRNFVISMGKQSVENRERFCSYARLLSSKGARNTIKVNGENLALNQTNNWPEQWNSFEARVTKMPVVTEGALNYAEAAEEWGSMMMGMILSLTDIVPIELDEEVQGYSEGSMKRVETNRYERNPLNRKLCLAAKGYSCCVCRMNFEDTYGDIGKGFIHVHHIIPVSMMGDGYVIDPIKDLVPVCPNCHAMLHRTDPPMMPEKLVSLMHKYRGDSKGSLYMVAEKSVLYGNKGSDGKFE